MLALWAVAVEETRALIEAPGHERTIPILIWGAGAIGGTLGADLRAGRPDVLFVDRAAEHVAAMNHDGPPDHRPDRGVPRSGARAASPERFEGAVRARLPVREGARHRGRDRAMAPLWPTTAMSSRPQNGLNEQVIAAIVGRGAHRSALRQLRRRLPRPGRRASMPATAPWWWASWTARPRRASRRSTA